MKKKSTEIAYRYIENLKPDKLFKKYVHRLTEKIEKGCSNPNIKNDLESVIVLRTLVHS